MSRLIRILAILVLTYLFGFLWFAFAMPKPAGKERTEAVIVLTGGEGRIRRALEVVDKGWAPRIFVAGVDSSVKPREFAAEYHVSARMMACCVTLDRKSVDTISNASEAAFWLTARRMASVRLVTSDWHMRRAVLELKRIAPADLRIVEDAVPSRPSFEILVLEYNKLLARSVASLKAA